MKTITDTDRIDFIERMLADDGIGEGCGVTIEQNALIGSQPGMEKVPVQIFTVPSQHQYGKTARDVIDIAMQFERGERDWEGENWEELCDKKKWEWKVYSIASSCGDVKSK